MDSPEKNEENEKDCEYYGIGQQILRNSAIGILDVIWIRGLVVLVVQVAFGGILIGRG